MNRNTTALIVASAFLCLGALATELVAIILYVDAFAKIVENMGVEPITVHAPQIRSGGMMASLALGMGIAGVITGMAAAAQVEYLPRWYRKSLVVCFITWIVLAFFCFANYFPAIGLGYSMISIASAFLVNRKPPKNSLA